MEIELYSKPERIRAELIHNTTRRERSPVSRTSDGNFSMRAADCGCQLVDDYHCLSIMKFDHTKFLFEDALQHVSYRAYYGIEICSALYFVTYDSDNNQNITVLFNDLHLAFAAQYILPYLYSHDGKSYDVFKLLTDSLEGLDLSAIDSSTYFYYQILPESGFTEITYDCSPKTIKVDVKSKILFDHSDQIIAPRVIKKSVKSQITFIEKLKKE